MLNLIGNIYGELTVKEYGEKIKRGGRNRSAWKCKCSCGIEKTICQDDLISLNTKSCGHLVKKHGLYKSTESESWRQLRSRCNNPKHKQYLSYGGRGIKVCKRWDSFTNFYEDMGPKPSRQHSIDRIDNNGNYEPSNCRWATKTEQQENRRTSILITYNGETHTAYYWSKKFNVDHKRYLRRKEKGWSDKAIIENPKFSHYSPT